MKLPNYQRSVLQAVVRLGFCKKWQIPDIAGYADGTIERAMPELTRLGLIEKVSGLHVATERGKILIAILIGQERRRMRAALQEAAE
jgi:hypothetical protein